MMSGTKIDPLLGTRHSKPFAEASPRVRETEVNLRLLSKILLFSAFVLTLTGGSVAIGSLTRGEGSMWFRLSPSKNTRPIGVIPV
jgi:hypothetical protein